MNRTIFGTGILFGALAILLGAFAAHGLQSLVDDSAIQTFQTGVTYQMYHALFLLILGSIKQIPLKKKKLVFYLIAIGVVMFSFSIYFLATNTLTSFDFKIIGFLTPIGGIFMVLGWILSGYIIFKQFD